MGELFSREEVRIFCMENNTMYGTRRPTLLKHVDATEQLIRQDTVSVEDMMSLADVFSPGTELRTVPGMNSRVGPESFRPPPGGPEMMDRFVDLMRRANEGEHPYKIHQEYLTLHPFRDGNGRTGRVLWAWGMINQNLRPWLKVGFLRAWYYQSAQFCALRTKLWD